jgi:hypothetical protein
MTPERGCYWATATCVDNLYQLLVFKIRQFLLHFSPKRHNAAMKWKASIPEPSDGTSQIRNGRASVRNEVKVSQLHCCTSPKPFHSAAGLYNFLPITHSELILHRNLHSLSKLQQYTQLLPNHAIIRQRLGGPYLSLSLYPSAQPGFAPPQRDCHCQTSSDDTHRNHQSRPKIRRPRRVFQSFDRPIRNR